MPLFSGVSGAVGSTARKNFLLRNCRGVFSWSGRGRSCLAEFRVIVKDKTLKYRVTGKPFEMVLLHFIVRPIGTPPVIRHSVNRSHHARTVTASLTMHKNWPIDWIVYEFQELSYSSLGRPLGSR